MKVIASHGANASSAKGLIAKDLKAYLDTADSSSYPGSGSTWYDLSGHGRNFTWSTVSFTSGSPGYFNTSGGYYALGPAANSFDITNTSGYTVQYLFYQNSAIASGMVNFPSTNGTIGTTAARGIFTHCSWSDGNIYFDQGGCCNADQRIFAAGGNLATWTLVSLVCDENNGQRRLYKNSTELVNSGANSTANINLSSSGVYVGNTDAYSGTNHRVGGFIVYNRPLSVSEISSNISWLKSRGHSLP